MQQTDPQRLGYVERRPLAFCILVMLATILVGKFLIVFLVAGLMRLPLRVCMLTGVALWGVAHLLLNGDSRSLVLFGGMTVWALVEIVAISHREGVWIKEPPPGWGAEAVTLLIAVVTIGVVVAIHPWISGVPVW